MSIPDDPVLAWWREVQMLLLDDWPMTAKFDLRSQVDTLVLSVEAAPGARLRIHRCGMAELEGGEVAALWVSGLFEGVELLFRDHAESWSWKRA
jgi:hypothetical protein